MSATGELFWNRGGGRPPDEPSRDAPRRPGTVYFAFKPEPDVADHVISIGNRLRTKHGLAGEVSPAVLHVTICPIGYFPELSEERIDAARKVAGRLMARSFEVTLDHVRTYPNGREKLPLVAFADNGVPGAALFRHALVADLRRGGFMFPSRLPEPHMTLFYDRRVVAEESIDPIHWMVRDFVLVHSIQREGRHEILGRWPLRS